MGRLSLNDEQQKEFIRDYLNGMLIEDIAEKHNISRQTVRRLANRFGIQRDTKSRMDVEQIKALLAEGKSRAEIAEILDVTYKQLANFMYSKHLYVAGPRANSRQGSNIIREKMAYKRKELPAETEPFNCTRETISQCYYASCSGYPTCCYLDIAHHSRAYPSTDILNVSPPSACIRFISKEEACKLGMAENKQEV